MAKLVVKFSDEFYKTLSNNLSRSEEIVKKVLRAGAEAALPVVKSNLAKSIGQGKTKRSTGELKNSLGITPVKPNKNGVLTIKLGFNEPRRKQSGPNRWRYSKRVQTMVAKRSAYVLTNAMAANILEHGKKGQPARPFLKPSKRVAMPLCRAAMIKAFEEEFLK